MSKIGLIEKSHLKQDLPKFRVGDQVQVHAKVQEGDKTRTQLFEGVVIKKRGTGIGSSFTVLRDVRGEIVEKVFPVHSPHVEKVVVKKKGKVTKAKLYYLRHKKAGSVS